MKNSVTIISSIVASAAVSAGIVFAASAYGIFSPSATKIAYVDVNKVIAESKDIKELKDYQRQKLEELQAFVAKAKKDIDAQKTEKAKKAVEAKYNTELNTRKNALDLVYTERLVAIDKTVSDLIKNKGKEQGYTIIVPKTALLSGGDDITATVIEAVK